MSDVINHTEIPDEIVEKAARAIFVAHEAIYYPEANETWESQAEIDKDEFRLYARAALEAAATSLRSQGMREASKVVVDRLLAYDELAAQLAMNTIAASAEEIEGIKK